MIKLLNSALELLKKIDKKGFKAYIVGGFARDLYLNRQSLDIDVCTNATPKDLSDIFKNIKKSNENYGSISLYFRNIRFEITTFRKELKYNKKRQPIKIKYIDSLLDDLKRRDFTINTLCIDSSGQMLDLLNVKSDLDAGIIRMVGNPKKKLKEDALRILRAVRFATILNFKLEPGLKKYLKKYGYLVSRLSSNRRKEELDKIFTSPNIKYGISLLSELGLLKPLDIPNLNEIVLTDSIIGIWAQLNYKHYKFTNHEQEMIDMLRELKNQVLLDNNVLYKYGLYVCEVAGTIKGIDYKTIAKQYQSIPIHSVNDIVLKASDIVEALNKPYGPYLKEIYADLEYNLVNTNLTNDKQVLTEYVIKKYKTTE